MIRHYILWVLYFIQTTSWKNNTLLYLIGVGLSSWRCTLSSTVLDGIPEQEVMDRKSKALPNSTFEYCHALAKQWLILYLLSDQMKFRADYIKRNYDLTCFKETFFSPEIGCLKKQKESFLHVIDAIQIDPSKTLFIDDNETNIVTANSVGLQGILYTDLWNLQETLKKYWIE